jgi:hypothetical protein
MGTVFKTLSRIMRRRNRPLTGNVLSYGFLFKKGDETQHILVQIRTNSVQPINI